jgi:regulator of sigma E protease
LEAVIEAAVKILAIAFALGLVIFVHELGHFLVARWAGVLVERFSIGFGPVVFALRRGETEYAISLIPLGGYVKMLGQTDLPAADVQVDDERSYQTQSVGKRMAIISAGVVMNLLFGFVCFAIAYRIGVPYSPSIIGAAIPAKPAWEAGMRAGDQITAINGRPTDDFESLLNAVQLAHPPHDSIQFEVDRRGTKLHFEVAPIQEKMKPMIGVFPPTELRLADPPTELDSPAALANNPRFESGDRILAVDDQPVESYVEFVEEMFARQDREVVLTVRRKAVGQRSGETVQVSVQPNYVRTLGLQMYIGEVVTERGVQHNSPATRAVDQAGNPDSIRAEDIITAVDGQGDFDPMRLPDIIAGRVGKSVELSIQRQGARPRETRLSLVPVQVPSWIDFVDVIADDYSMPMNIPSLGVSYRVSNTVRKVVEDSPAAKAEPRILPDDVIRNVEFIEDDRGKIRTISLEVNENNWPCVFWHMQDSRVRKLTLTIERKSDGKPTQFTVSLEPQRNLSWPIHRRGLIFAPAFAERKADSIPAAISAGIVDTHTLVTSLYLYLRGLVIIRTLSFKTLGGPIEITRRAYHLVEDIPVFIRFFGFLSIQLAVINFLPIPVLDGGHMVFLLYEGVARRKPGERVVSIAHYFGLAFLLSLILFVFGLDIVRFYWEP